MDIPREPKYPNDLGSPVSTLLIMLKVSSTSLSQQENPNGIEIWDDVTSPHGYEGQGQSTVLQDLNATHNLVPKRIWSLPT